VPRISAGSRANPPFFYKIIIKLSIFNKLENFNKFTKLSNDFGEFDDKLRMFSSY